MNKTAELVRLWAEYEAVHPEASIDEFCQYFLIAQREKEKTDAEFLGGILPPDVYSQMAKMLGRLSKLHLTYLMPELKECGIASFEEFLYLNSVNNTTSPKKTHIIYSNFSELSSGLLILDRLMQKGLLSEEEDAEDRRSKRLTLTETGKQTLRMCYQQLSEVNEFFFHFIPDEDIQLCLQLLTPLESRFSAWWQEHKGKRLADIKQLLKNEF